MARRPSAQTQAVIHHLLSSGRRWSHGYDVSTALGIASGTLYPILMRFHDRGIIETRWEDSPLEGRPRRHLCRLTPEGEDWAREVLAIVPGTLSTRPAETPA